ncbi:MULTISPECIES: polysaccharide pyruvyl transferase family protein [Bacteroides]|uniref:polysaccharide pyruvyl transferase family protein n=3 Tax=Bacteroides TaxID=816 RepID=UPI0023F8D98D|nr:MULTISPECIES: polysaccharide pyruvyl transferase family protein [Bacteroides]
MKLGILTFHCAHNYGAILQCFGLQEYLKSLGYDVYVIDYRPKYLTRGYKRHSLRNWICSKPLLTMQKLMNEPFLYKTRSERYDNFNAFIETKLRLYPYTKGMDFSEFDAIFLGSDQIWEASITDGKFDDVFFGTGAKCKVISYAASNKAKVLTSQEIDYYQQHLSKYAGIGVREITLQKLLSDVIRKPVVFTVDPTILAGNLLTDGIESKRPIEQKYVLVYEIVEHQKVIEQAKRYAKKIGARVVMLNAYIEYTEKRICDFTASPSDFVNYIRYAECVFTTSFHGTAISIICNTNFYSFKQHNASDLRISSLLSIAGLNDRFVEMVDDLDIKQIDYSNVLKNVEMATEISRDFIKYALS